MGKHLDFDQKTKILLLNTKLVGPSAIAKTMKLPKSTIINFINRYEITGTVYNNYKANKPKKIDDRMARRLARVAIANRRATTQKLKELLELDCDLKTIRNSLKKSGIRARRPLKKPGLNKAQKNVRFQWAKAHQN